MEFTNTSTATEVLPPPYTPPVEDMFGDDGEEEESTVPTTNITINAPTSVHGSHNVVSLSSMDPSRLTAILMSALNQKLQQTEQQNNYNIQLNCGITVMGDRNVIGNVGVRSRPALATTAAVQSTGRTVAEDAAKTTLPSRKRRPSEVYSASVITDNQPVLTIAQEPEASPAPKRIEPNTVAGSSSFSPAP